MKSKFVPGVFVGLLLRAVLSCPARTASTQLLNRIIAEIADRCADDLQTASMQGNPYSTGYYEGEANGLWLAQQALATGVMP